MKIYEKYVKIEQVFNLLPLNGQYTFCRTIIFKIVEDNLKYNITKRMAYGRNN